MLTIDTVRAARERIQPYIRRTPLLRAEPVKEPIAQVGTLGLKLECLQISGSFKARGAINAALSLAPEDRARGLVTASGGNHGLGVAYAGWRLGVPVTIYLAHNTPAIKAQLLEGWGARVVFAGAVWDDANAAALQAAESEGLAYIHPFADERVIAGQGTIAFEILEDLPEVETILVAIGGGGLISGVSLAAQALRPGVRIIGVEPVGAPTLSESIRAGQVVELPAITTVANTLAPRRSSAINLEIIQRHVAEIVLVDDDQMRAASRWLWRELGVAAELSGAASVAALLAGAYRPRPNEVVCALVCGAGSDGIQYPR